MANEFTHELKDLDVDRVDAVDKPANGRAFALYKSRDGQPLTKGQETPTMAQEITKSELAEIMKQYASVATAADMLLKALRKDTVGKVSKSTAIAVNGLAQIMGAEPVFVSKAVPTQPYEYSEPDVDKRGPADENIGGNFTPRSMPGSMVGKVQFSVKGVEKAGAAPVIAEDEKEKPVMPPFMDEMKSLLKAQGEQIEALKAEIAKGAPVTKVEKSEKPESKQVLTDEQRQVRKSQGYRFGESFEDVVFGNGAGR